MDTEGEGESLMNDAECGPLNGTLFLHGGGYKGLERFFELIGGRDLPLVVIPTAQEGDHDDSISNGMKLFLEAGFTHVTQLHTRDRNEANQDDFVEPLRQAKAVWFMGGRQWRLADSYSNTLVHKELFHLLDRGGVIGGTSAGASIQGSLLVRGDTKSNEIMLGDHLEGFGFLKHLAIDQHLLKKNRQFDLIDVIDKYPELLGIGLDEDTGIIVERDTFEVVGESYAAIYNYTSALEGKGGFYFLAPGDRFSLKTRERVRS